MRTSVTISHRGAAYELGRGPDCYGIWPVGAAGAAPLEWWPATDEGWSAAWYRFMQLEPGGAPVAPAPPARAGASRGARAAGVALTGAGVACGIAGLFPGYLGGQSLASQAYQLVPHLLYLGAWILGGALALAGGAGASLGLGASAVIVPLLLADVGEAIAGTAGGGPGLALTFAGALLCAAGAVTAFWAQPAAGRGRPAGRGHQGVPAAATMLAGLGAAIAFAPSWDRFTLRAAGGFTQTITAGNAFANPAPVIAGDVLTMAAIAAIAALAAVWRPGRAGAALLAGGVVPLVAQAASAVLQIRQPATPGQFGISPGQAARLGLTIGSGLTLAFWVYCAFVLALVLAALWLGGGPDLVPGAVQAPPAGSPPPPGAPAGPSEGPPPGAPAGLGR